MVISKKGLKKLGKSLRNEVQVSSSESLKVLKTYRRTFDPFLISAGNEWLILALAGLVIQYMLIVPWEEARLKAVIGQPYTEYCNIVNRWLIKPPKIKSVVSTQIHSFNNALKQEKSTLLAIMLMLSTLTLCWYIQENI